MSLGHLAGSLERNDSLSFFPAFHVLRAAQPGLAPLLVPVSES